MSDNLKTKGITAFIWEFSGKLISNGMGFIISIFLARLLEPSEFGLIAMVMVVIGIASVFSDSGLSVALIQRRIRPIHYSSVFYFNIVIAACLTLLTFFSANWIAKFYNNEELIPLVQVLSLSFLIGAFSSVQNIRLQKELNFALITKINITASLLSGVVAIILAFNGAKVWSLVIQTLLSGIILNILFWYFSKWKPESLFSMKALIQLWSFGFNIFLNRFLDAIVYRIDVLIIGKLYTPATLGFYNRSKALNDLIISYSAGSIVIILFPLLSKIQNDLVRFQNIIIKLFGTVAFVTFLLLGIFYLISEELIVLLFSEKWLQSVGYFKVLILAGFHYPLSYILITVLTSRGKSKLYLYNGLITKTIYACNLYIGFLWGIDGFLYGLIVVSFLNLGINMIFATTEIKMPVWSFFRIFITQIFITFVSGWIVLMIVAELDYGNLVMLFIKGVMYILTYFLINIFLRTTTLKYALEELKPILDKYMKRRKKR